MCSQGKKVEYSLRAIPLGGYVALPEDDPKSGFKDDDPDLMKNRPVAQRALVISAGVIANIIFAFSVLFVQASLSSNRGGSQLMWQLPSWVDTGCDWYRTCGTAVTAGSSEK